MNTYLWNARLVSVDTGETLRRMVMHTGTNDRKKAYAKALYAWGIDHAILIGTRIIVTPVLSADSPVLYEHECNA